ncbi:MAG: PAS domain-containing protein [Rickettsiales bacterium]
MKNANNIAQNVSWIEKAAEISHVGYWKYDLKTQQLSWSKRVYEIHGVNENEFKLNLDKAVNFYHPEDRPRLIASLDLCIKSKKTFSLKARIITPQAIVKFVEANSFFSENEHGEITELYGTFYDLSEYVSQNNRLVEIEQRYAKVTKASQKLVWIWNAKSSQFLLADDICKIINLAHQTKMSNVLRLIHKEDVGKVISNINSIKKHLVNIELEFRILNKEQKYIWLNVKSNSITSTNNKLELLQGTIEDISEVKYIRDILLRNEKYTKAYIDDALIGTALVSISGEWYRVNKSLCNLLGYSQAELLQLTFQDITHPDDLADSFKMRAKLLKNELNSYILEKRYIHKQGHIIHTLLHVTICRDENNKPLYFISNIQDISSIIKDKKKIAKSEERLEFALSASDIGVWDLDLKNKVIFISKKWQKIIGYKQQNIKANHKLWQNIIHPDDLAKLKIKFTEHIKNKTNSLNIEVRLKNFDNEYIWAVISGRIVEKANNGKIKRIVGTISDLNSKTKTYRILQKICTISANFNLDLKSKITLLLKEIITYLSLDTGIIFKYKNNYQIIKYKYGTPKKSLSAHKEYVYFLDNSKYQDEIFIDFPHLHNNKKVAKFNSVIGAEISINNRKYGSILFFGQQYRSKFSEEEVAVIKLFAQWLSSQISQHNYLNALIRSETRLEDSVEKLKDSNNELARFAYIASHDLQEPLRTVTSLTELLATKYGKKLDSKAQQYINYMVDAATNMKNLVTDLLEYSKIDNQAQSLSEEVNLNNTLQHVLDNLHETIKSKKVKLTIDMLPVVKGNYLAYISLFQNLISNALKYAQDNIEQFIRVKCEDNGSHHLIIIEDNGIGIEKEYYQQIFEPFNRLESKNKYPGSGIGLAICKKIIQQLSGEIWVESKLNIGSKFYFTIPY